MQKYWGDFKSVEDMNEQFRPSVPIRDEDVICAYYEIDGYEGFSFALLYIDGQYMDNEASHCSCYGLEDQWKPQPTILDAISKFKRYSAPEGFRTALQDYIAEQKAVDSWQI